MPHADAAPEGRPSARAGWRTWLFIGATGFGGPAGQLAILHRELVERHRWIGEEEFLAAMRLCLFLPGPEAQQLATYAGWRLGGVRGGILSGTLFVLPGAILVTILAWVHAAGGRLPLVRDAFAGTRPAVVALVALAAWRIGRRSLRSPAAVGLAAAAGLALAAGVAFPVVALLAAVCGLLAPAGGLGEDERPAAAGPSNGDVRTGGVARRVLATAAVWAIGWLACYAAVVGSAGAGGRGAQIARLFTETTLLSFGGAYAVVPWALDESLARGWLEPAERFDALAMGEATPGPLILVVTFIGFLAGWRTSPDGDAGAGLAGATIATTFAFLPSFALVLTLAPFVRSIRPGSRPARALTAVGCAVVAAIVMLILGLARDALVPGGRPAPLPIAVAAASGLVLARSQAATPLVVLAAAAIGAVAGLIGS